MELIIDITNKFNIIIDYHCYNELPFQLICCYGHINLLNWFYSLLNQSVKLEASDGYALLLSSSNGFIDVVNWLIDHDKNNSLNSYLPNALEIAHMNHHLNVASYLYDYCKTKLNSYYE